MFKELIFFVVIQQVFCTDECELCQRLVSGAGVKDPGENINTTRIRMRARFPENTTQEDWEFIDNFLNYDLRKAIQDRNKPVPGMTSETCCADLGHCDPKKGFLANFTIVNITDITNNTNLRTSRDKDIIMLHHTVTPTLQETIDVLNERELSVQYIVDRNGSIFQMAFDWRRAWHAGEGSWLGDGCQSTDMNSRAIGIEIVNTGDQPFNDVQSTSVYKLVKYLQTKWHVYEQNIIAHHQSAPSRKQDVSGYFDWVTLSDDYDIWPGIYNSTLTDSEKKEVFLNSTILNETLLEEVQQKLHDYGYGELIIGDDYNNSTSDVTTEIAVESFNRRFAPEVFIKETIDNETITTISNPWNRQVFGITMERLDKIHSMLRQQTCTLTDY